MGGSTSRLRILFDHGCKASDLGTAFNLILVGARIRPFYCVSDDKLKEVQSLIELYGSKDLRLEGSKVCPLVSKPEASTLWPLSTSLTTGSSALDSHLYYHLDAFVLLKNSKTKVLQSALFYSFEAPEPLTPSTKTALFHAMMKAYHLAERLSKEHLSLSTDLSYHAALSPSLLHSLARQTMAPSSLPLLKTYLETNGFGKLSEALAANPSLATSPAFYSKILAPVLSFEASGILGSLGTSSTDSQVLSAQKSLWASSLLASLSQSPAGHSTGPRPDKPNIWPSTI